MRVIRINTALGLLLTGVLLMAAQFVLVNHPSVTHSRPRTVLTSDADHAGTKHTRAAGCHEESAPKDQAPENHDCCMVGHLHAIGSAPVIIAPAFAVNPVNGSLLQSASIEQNASQTNQISDTGPPGSVVPIRI